MANIFQQFLQPVRSVSDYTADMDKRDLMALQLEGARGQNALTQLTRQQQMEQARQNAIERAALAEEAQRAGGDPSKLIQGLRARGLPGLMTQADTLETGLLNRKDKEADAAKKAGETADAAVKRYRSALDYIDTPQGAARWMQAQYADPVIGQFMQGLGPLEQSVSRIPQDPQGFAEWRQRTAMGMEKFAELERKKAEDAQRARNDLVTPSGQVNTTMLDAKKQVAAAGASTVSVNTGQKGLDNTLKLRGDFRSEPVYKAHQEMQAAYSQIQQALKQASPAGDLAGATKIMKLLDPGSVVRESELGMAMAASGLLDRVQNYAQNIINGTKLTPTQRADFLKLAAALYGESVRSYNSKRSEYEGIAQRNQLPVPDVVGAPADAKVFNFSDLK